jgi:dTDP-4-amino-4,6-dideoxygalactose transaminase
MKDNSIYVTQPSLPPFEEYITYLKKIWQNKRLTNGGPFHQELEEKLAAFLGVKHISLFANGTLALLTALQALKISGEVITSPYSFVATTNSLWWNNIKPVFADVDPLFGNLDPNKIEQAITPKTTAIMPIHVYGNPCNVEHIQKIADTYGLKIIYDAAHTFGNKYKGQSILNFGDLSTLSFHATKTYNTMEGGAIICHDIKTKQRIDNLKNFGFVNETTVMAPGINSKMNEMQAALGLLQLKYHQTNIEKRSKIAKKYDKELKNVSGIETLSLVPKLTNFNYGYFPIFIDENKYGKSRDQLYNYLKENNIYGRRYFYPLISDFSTYRGLESANKGNLTNAHSIADKVICLPIYPDLDLADQQRIINLIKR